MKYEDYQYIAKELAVRHAEIKTILDAADENDLISSDNAKIMLSNFFISIGELKMKEDNGMEYFFDINYFRIHPIDNSSIKDVPLPKTIDGLKLSSLLKDNDTNPLHWYDLWKEGHSPYSIAKNITTNIDAKEIKKQVLKLDDAINTLRYRELAS